MRNMNTLRLETVTLPEVGTEREIGTEEVSGEELLSDKPWHVVLLDDNMHTYDYVIEMLCKVFGYNVEKAFTMAVEVDTCKRVIVATCHLEIAEMRRQQIHEYGPDWRISGCKGSMSAVLERVE